MAKFTEVTRIRLKFWLIVLFTLIMAFLVYPPLWNSSAQWVNGKLDKVKYLDQINIPNFYNKPFRLGLDLQGGTHLVYRADVSKVPAGTENEALEGVRDVIERRVNMFGVSEPNVQTNRVSDEYRVIVELAGVQDVKQAIQMIGETPILEFKEQNTAVVDDAAQLTLAQDLIARIKKGEDFATLAKQYGQDSSASAGGDLGFVGKGMFVPEFEKAIFEDLKTGEVTNEPIKTQFGYHIIQKLEEKTVDGALQVSSRHILLATQKQEWLATQLSGKNLVKAEMVFNQNSNLPEVSLEFNDEGKTLFAEITTRNVGKPVGIFLDGAPITTPTVNEPIKEGKAVINGKFTIKEAKDLAMRLNAGALPVPIELIGQQTIGPSLGKVSIDKSLTAGLIGFLLVIIFMIGYYRLPGLLASIALIIYGLINLSIFKLIPVTLTLSGIAGFILSLGMAVDANVLIFERLKEELKEGEPLGKAMDNSFVRAWPSIRDGNITTLITSFILMLFTASMIKGFAVTLSIGVLTSMFTAIIITRALMKFAGKGKLRDYGKLWLK